MISKKKEYGVWGVLLTLSPIILIVVSNYYSLSSIFSLDYIVFLFIAIIVALNPVKTKNSVLFLTTGISLSVFVLFGLLAEIILTTLCLVILLIKAKIRTDEHYRYPLNIVLFQLLSVVTALIYYVTDNILTVSNTFYRLFILMNIYMVAHILGNQIITYSIKKYFFNIKDVRLVDEDLLVSISILICIIPLSFILTYLYIQLDIMGAFIGALPFLTVSVGVNVFFKNKVNSTYAEQVSNAAIQLSEKRTSIEVIEKYMNQVADIFPADHLSFFKVLSDGKVSREYIYDTLTGPKKAGENFQVSEQSILKESIRTNSTKFYNCSQEWKSGCINNLSYNAESVIVLPIFIQNRVDGLILLSHQSKNMYNSMLLSLIKSLHKYFVISLENAIQIENLEANSETDFLTGLPNLKSFSKKFEEAFNNVNSGVSLILLDLDFFKKINDKYGHQAGNEILQHVADVLMQFQEESRTVARYGGEEFVLLLPDVEKKAAGLIAEDIRRTIADTEYEIRQGINCEETQIIKLTASVGVANYPEDCCEADELIAIADKAMYIGSKQKGRNRVTVAGKGRKNYESKALLQS